MGEKKNTGIYFFIAILLVLVLVLGGYIVYDKILNNSKSITNNEQDNDITNNEVNNNQNNSENTNSNENTNSSNDVSFITSEIQSVYDNAYEVIAEGSGIHSPDIVDIKVGEEGNVAGVIDVKAYKLDFTILEPYFTDRAINFVKFHFTDTPYAHKDGNYYIFMGKNEYSYDKKDFVRTIFGQTDQRKRTLKVKFYSDDMVVAVSEKSSFMRLDEYIIFKKVNNSWKIDMFEEF